MKTDSLQSSSAALKLDTSCSGINNFLEKLYRVDDTGSLVPEVSLLARTPDKREY